MSLFGDKVRPAQRGLLWDDAVAPRREPPPPVYVYTACRDFKIRRFTADGKLVDVVAELPSGTSTAIKVAASPSSIVYTSRQGEGGVQSVRRLYKANFDGGLQWSIPYGFAIGNPYDIAIDHDGFIYVGSQNSSAAPGLTKVGTDGEIIWTGASSGRNEHQVSVYGGADGGIYTKGGIFNEQARKYDKAGSLLWTASGSSSEQGGVAANPDGSVYTYGPRLQGIVKYSPEGSLIFGNLPLYDYTSWSVRAVCSSPAGCHFVAVPNIHNPPYELVLINHNGAVQWQAPLPGDSVSIDVSREGVCYVASGADLLAYSPSGSFMWAVEHAAVINQVACTPGKWGAFHEHW